MSQEIRRLLEKAVELQQSIKLKKETHAELVKLLKEQRASIIRDATQFAEGSPGEDEANRKLDLLDKKEFDAHERFRNFLKLCDREIQSTIRQIVEQRFGPDWDSD